MLSEIFTRYYKRMFVAEEWADEFNKQVFNKWNPKTIPKISYQKGQGY